MLPETIEMGARPENFSKQNHCSETHSHGVVGGMMWQVTGGTTRDSDFWSCYVRLVQKQ
jgi:hypothetical protein